MNIDEPGEPETADRIEAWNQVFRDSQVALTAFLTRRLAQQADVEDCLQAVFVKAVKQGNDIPAAARRAWLFRVAANESSQFWRKEAINQRALEKQTNVSVDESLSIVEHLIENESVERIQVAIKRLPEEWQQVVELRIQRDLTFKEIASELDVPIGTALTQMRRALERLRADLNPSNE